jgi:peroxiredoxin
MAEQSQTIFPSLSTQVCDWVRKPYSDMFAQPENLTLREEEELCQLELIMHSR